MLAAGDANFKGSFWPPTTSPARSTCGRAARVLRNADCLDAATWAHCRMASIRSMTAGVLLSKLRTTSGALPKKAGSMLFSIFQELLSPCSKVLRMIQRGPILSMRLKGRIHRSTTSSLLQLIRQRQLEFHLHTGVSVSLMPMFREFLRFRLMWQRRAQALRYCTPSSNTAVRCSSPNQMQARTCVLRNANHFRPSARWSVLEHSISAWRSTRPAARGSGPCAL